MTHEIWERWRCIIALLLLLLIGNSGCGNKQLEDLAAKAKQGIEGAKKQANDVSQSVQKGAQEMQKLPGAVAAVTAGDIKLTLDTPLNATTCAARFLAPANGRPGVFQIGTSVTSGPKSFPAVFIHAPTTAASLQGLVGQTIPAQVFVAKSESQGHFQSTADKPVQLQIMKLENNIVTCQLQAAELTSLDPSPTGQALTVPVAGTLVGAVQP
ncbi:hypothetical protein [Anatilimnocola floriformis]|uniref:hypothetical protein n=1 Tax=Anatilimnocola floriformis TaxID=2948575 RepID=UPI0020C455AF|nr:hypothetical protein [Anatilimnocola floriformis]